MTRCSKKAEARLAPSCVALSLTLALLPLTSPGALAADERAVSGVAQPAPAASAVAAPPVDSRYTVPMQLSRLLPPASLRGELVLTQPPEATLNGKPARLAPGARIRGQNNLLVMWGVLIGQKLKVNYTIDPYGLVMDVWILRPDELSQRWPGTAEEAAKWVYDPLKQTWTKP